MKNYSLIMGISLFSAILLFNNTTGIAYAQQGTPFLQEEIDAINEIIEEILADLERLENLKVSWMNVTDIPGGFVDGIDNDVLMEITASCTVDQIVKWNGTNWNCADDIDNDVLMEISSVCTVNQIVKWDGVQWNCADSAENDEGGEVALRKLDCLLVSAEYSRTKSFGFQEGCNLDNIALESEDDLSNLNLSFATLTGEVFFDVVNVTNTDFSYADLTLADFDGAVAVNADFTGANLYGVEFYQVDLTGADFTGANLTEAEFQNDSDLTGADFTGANLSSVIFDEDVILTDAVFTGAYASPECTDSDNICSSLPAAAP